MKKLIIVLLPTIILSFSYGIAGSLDSPEDTGHKISKKTSNTLTEYFLKKAKTYENIDELQRALFYLKIAGTLSPDDKKIAGEISGLKAATGIKSDTHFKKGKKLYGQNRFEEARNQFLTALRYNPDEKPALDYLKNRRIPKEYIFYTPGKDDSLKSISEKFYKDPDLDFLIAYFNNLETGSEPKPGKTLMFPILPAEVKPAAIDIRQDIISAKRLLEEKKYQAVIEISDSILKKDHSNKAVIDLKNQAFYQIGMEMLRNEKYFEAVSIFRKIPPGYEGVNEAIQEAFQKELLKAENLLKEKKYDASIDLSEKILSYDRSHAAARKIISTAYCQQGKGLLIRKKYAEALKVLNKADPADDCIEKMRSAIQLSMIKEAEMHYLRGVKHFLNEDLQNAINEWEMTLRLHPTHDKAKKNINNARNLLEKLDKVK
jgi:tetratricopeptide (TPR) repeat protein